MGWKDLCGVPGSRETASSALERDAAVLPRYRPGAGDDDSMLEASSLSSALVRALNFIGTMAKEMSSSELSAAVAELTRPMAPPAFDRGGPRLNGGRDVAIVSDGQDGVMEVTNPGTPDVNVNDDSWYATGAFLQTQKIRKLVDWWWPTVRVQGADPTIRRPCSSPSQLPKLAYHVPALARHARQPAPTCGRLTRRTYLSKAKLFSSPSARQRPVSVAWRQFGVKVIDEGCMMGRTMIWTRTMSMHGQYSLLIFFSVY